MTVEKPKFFSSEYLRYREDGLPKEYLLEGASDEDKQEYESYFNAPRMVLEYKSKYPEIRK